MSSDDPSQSNPSSNQSNRVPSEDTSIDPTIATPALGGESTLAQQDVDATILGDEGDETASRPTVQFTAQARRGEAGSRQRFGDYELLREIARGGMGVVYEARQVSLNRIVALKMILAGKFADNEDVQRFYTEAEAAAKLDHWGIVPIYEVGEHDGRHYFSMAYVTGQSLADRIREGPIEPHNAAELCVKIAQAVAYAHQKMVIHRDLKPANILLDRDGTPKVTDFGLAKQVESQSGLTRTGAVMGTPSFMPPEQASGNMEAVGPLADVYSLGAILYCLLTGRPPFQAANVLDTLTQVLDQQPVLPRRLVPTTPVDLESICMKCLEKDPSLRYASANEFADDLGRFLAGEPVEADESSTLRRAWSSLLRESRHVEVLANWGKVWQWHSVQIFALFLLTNALIWMNVRSPVPYVAVWAVGFVSLLVPIWFYRVRSLVPLTPIERQLGQVWGMFFCVVIATGTINHLMGFEPLQLLPVAVLECALAFGCMAAILGGSFYPMAVLCFVLSIVLTLVPQIGPIAFGSAFALGLLIPGLKFSMNDRGYEERLEQESSGDQNVDESA